MQPETYKSFCLNFLVFSNILLSTFVVDFSYFIGCYKVNTKANIHKKPPTKIYMYKKGNMEGIQSDLTSSFKKFEEDSNKEDVETTQTNFRDILHVTETIEIHHY